jgi:hypothetical protein
MGGRGEELDLHPFPARNLSLSLSGAFCAPLAVHNGIFSASSPLAQRGQPKKKEGFMMKCGKLFVVGMMLTGLVVASA